MITVFKTVHGSTYEIDWDAKTWTQLQAGQDKDPQGLRSTTGPFIAVGDIEIGQRVNIWAPALVATANARLISTSPVVSMEGF